MGNEKVYVEAKFRSLFVNWKNGEKRSVPFVRWEYTFKYKF